MRDDELRLGDVFAQEGRSFLEIVDARADEERLAAAITLAQQRFAHDQRVEGRDEAAHGEPVDRRRGDQREFAHAGHRELQRARNRRRRQRQHMHLGAQLLQALLMADAEMLLLVDDDETEILKIHALAENSVRPDQNIDAALAKFFLGVARLGGADHARQPPDSDGQALEALREILVVLARQQRRRRDDGHLPAVDGRAKGGAQRDLGFAKADIAAHQTIHRAPGSEIVEHGVDRARLILGLVIGKARAKFVVETFGRDKLGRLLQHALRRDRDQALGHFANAVLHAGLAALPAGAAQTIERYLRVLGAVARQKLDVFDGKIELVPAGVMNLQTVVRRAGGGDRFEADEAPDAVIDMHDEIARRQRGDLAQQILCALVLLAPAHQPVAQNILLADNSEAFRLEAMLYAEHGQRDGAFAKRQRAGQAGDERRQGQPVLGEHMAKPLARALRPRRDDDALALRRQRLDVVGGGLKHVDLGLIALGREVASGPRGKIEAGRFTFRRREGREARLRSRAQPRPPFLRRQIKFARLQRLVIRASEIDIIGALARLVIIRDLRQPLASRVVDLRVEQQRRVAEIIEQRVEFVVEQRQPMFGAGMAAALADRFVKRVAARLAAKARRIGLAEAAHRLADELQLAHRHEVERAQLPGGALRFRIEGADRFERVAEEIEPDRRRHARREKIDNAAALRIFAGLAHRAGAQKTVGRQPLRQQVHLDDVSRRGGKSVGGDSGARRNALEQTVHRRGDHARLLGGGFRARQPRQRGHAARGDRSARRDAVIGLAVPAGQVENFDEGRGEAQRLAKLRRARDVPRDMHEDGRLVLGSFRQRAREIAGDEGVEPLGRVGEKQLVAGLQSREGGF